MAGEGLDVKVSSSTTEENRREQMRTQRTQRTEASTRSIDSEQVARNAKKWSANKKLKIKFGVGNLHFLRRCGSNQNEERQKRTEEDK